MAYIGKEPGSGLRGRFIYTATAGQTSFTGSDSLGRTLTYTDGEYTDVFLNGVKLDKTDYTATSGTSIVLDSGASADDTLEILAFDTFGLFSGEFAQDVSVGGDLTISDKIIHSGDTNTAIRFADADTVTVETGGSERVRVLSDGKVAIGGTTAEATLDVMGNSDSVAALKLNGGNDNYGFHFYTTASEGDLAIKREVAGTQTEAMRIVRSSGTIRASAGLLFGSDTADANTLDDYEEGTWTPVYQALTSNPTVTHSVQIGRYVKIGAFVNVMFRIQTSAVSGGSGAVVIGGLPFATTNVSSLFASGPVGFSQGFTNVHPQTLLVGANATQIQPITNNGSDARTAVNTSVTPSDLTNGSSKNDLIGSISYRTDA